MSLLPDDLSFPQRGGGHPSGNAPFLGQADVNAMVANAFWTNQSLLVDCVRDPLQAICKDVSQQVYSVVDERLVMAAEGRSAFGVGVRGVEESQAQASKEMRKFKADMLARLPKDAGSGHATPMLSRFA